MAEATISSSSEDDAQLTDNGEVMLRQIRAAWISNGVVSSQNFQPLPKDNFALSLERGSLIGAEAAFVRWTGWGRDSAAVFGIEVGKFASLNIPCFSAPVEDPNGEHNPEHAVAKFPAVRSQAQKAAGRLKTLATVQYMPPPPDDKAG